jgi:molybdopterin molybdotransferase
MLNVKTPDEALDIIAGAFSPMGAAENVPLDAALGRILSADVRGSEYVPDFHRSTVDGYAAIAADTFGCSDSTPAVLEKRGSVLMGETPDFALRQGQCAAIPTGGALPEGADCAVMIEYTEDYGDGTIGILKSAAPGSGVIFRGDDVYPGKSVLTAGRRLTAQDIGALAAMGITNVAAVKKPAVGIISTGDELVPPSEKPADGQMRDVNSAMLAAMMVSFGAEAVQYGIVRDSVPALEDAVDRALSECGMVLISGGSSVGEKDAACRVIASRGELLFHGLAMKPGKPAILGSAEGKPLFGLPGHPAAAYFVAAIFVRAALAALTGEKLKPCGVTARIAENVSANHGRAEYIGVRLTSEGGALIAHPIRTKSGLITSLAGSDGYFCIPRDCEGVSAGETISVIVNTGG